MSSNSTYSKRHTKSNSSKRSSSALPDDETMANRYIKWKKLLDKFDKPFPGDEDGLDMDDLVAKFADEYEENSYDQSDRFEEAIECSSEEESDKENHRSNEYSAFKKQLEEDMKKRTAAWKTNGMERIFNSNFTTSVDDVQRWLQNCRPGTSNQVTRERETRFTEYEGNAQMDVTRKENVSILNDTQKQQLATENSSSCVYSDNGRKCVIVHQVEKTTISTYMELPGLNHTAVADKLDFSSTIDKLDFSKAIEGIEKIAPFKMPLAKKLLKEEKDKGVKVSKEGNWKGANTGMNVLKENSSRKGVNGKAQAKHDKPSPRKNDHKNVPKSRIIENVQPQKGNANNNKQEAQCFSPKKFRRIIYSKPSDESETIDLSDSSENHSTCAEKKYKSKKENSKKHAERVKQPKEREKAKQNDSPTRVLSSTITKLKVDDSKSNPETNGKKLPANANKPSCADGLQKASTQPAKTVNYPMPKNYRQMLSKNGHCMYKTEGIVIYRPKHQELPREAKKISINSEDLDLSGIKSGKRRSKFRDFNRVIQSNATLVYYETDEERSENIDSDSSDDPILNFKPELCILAF